MNFYGLRQAKGIVKALSVNVKGQADPYAKGYRAALKDAEAAIKKEIAATLPAKGLPDVLQD